jgi:hypothetical protein
VLLEGFGKLKKFNNLIGNRTRDLAACSIVPQPTTLSLGSQTTLASNMSPPSLGFKNNQAKNQSETGSKLCFTEEPVGVLYGLFFDF